MTPDGRGQLGPAGGRPERQGGAGERLDVDVAVRVDAQPRGADRAGPDRRDPQLVTVGDELDLEPGDPEAAAHLAPHRRIPYTSASEQAEPCAAW